MACGFLRRSPMGQQEMPAEGEASWGTRAKGLSRLRGASLDSLLLLLPPAVGSPVQRTTCPFETLPCFSLLPCLEDATNRRGCRQLKDNTHTLSAGQARRGGPGHFRAQAEFPLPATSLAQTPRGRGQEAPGAFSIVCTQLVATSGAGKERERLGVGCPIETAITPQPVGPGRAAEPER